MTCDNILINFPKNKTQNIVINQLNFFMITNILLFIHLGPNTAYSKRPLCQKPKVMSWSMN